MTDCMDALPLPPAPSVAPRVVSSPPVTPTRVERVPGKRRLRRKAQLEYLLSLERPVVSDDAEDLLYRSNDASKQLIENEDLLRKFLNGATLRTQPPRGPPRQGQFGRPAEARRGWLRVERKLRPCLKKAKTRDLLGHVDSLISRWIANADTDEVNEVFEPTVPCVASRSSVLRIPTCVVEPQIAKGLAQFYGSRVLKEEKDFIVLRRPNPRHRLQHDATIYDVL
eukprot:CAMPEP_0118904560 /NCGR_PEP_ID=MMETSP1166-20130328/8973_1 /TAXON_ID=1104430 /ORGANISM="Chrysoreinhardia sp, Strain CCMP3193" /LENGTH=224 /DNA_ID=CAMNT_0006843817 /DNA_START=183 /DNA_END=857 /DNA_ORIENTATION=-